MPVPTGFTYRQQKDGAIGISHHGRLAATLRKREALDFLDEIQELSPEGGQELMARMTGNYKRGNEGHAKAHFRNRP